MFKHVLIPIDLSGRNARQLKAALELARRGNAAVTLLHVIHRVGDASAKELRGFYQQLEAGSQRKLDRAARGFAARRLRVRTEVLVGEPASEIARFAARRKVDLIVMSSHTVRPERPGLGWGTTSHKVSLLCPCPILLVK